MDNITEEQIKVREMILRINPDIKANYEGMLKALEKVNPIIGKTNISYPYKRVMYLQLIAHSITENCRILKNKVSDEQLIQEFVISVQSFCREYANSLPTHLSKKKFDQNQRFACEVFIKRWEEIERQFLFFFLSKQRKTF